MKPWHLKATYQLYDDKGSPTGQGTYEYWWVSPQEYRSSWTRPGAAHTDWYLADGKHEYSTSGEPLRFYERHLQSAILSPLPDAEHIDPAKYRIDRDMMGVGAAKFPCLMVMRKMPTQGRPQPVPMGLFPTYCFDPQQPVLRFSYAFGGITTEFNKLVKMQDRILPREVVILEGTKKLLTAEVDSITGLDPADPALAPSPDSQTVGPHTVNLDGGMVAGRVLKKVVPVYPQDAKTAHISGTVKLEATIGADGAVHNLEVISAPSPSLAASAMRSAIQWQFRPFLLNGKPVDVTTTINVIYDLR